MIADKYFEATGIRLEYGPPRLERHYRYYNPLENVMERDEGEYFLVKPSRGLEDIM